MRSMSLLLSFIMMFNLMGCSLETGNQSNESENNSYSLEFQPVEIQQKVSILEANEIKSVLKEENFEGSKVFIHTNPTDEEHIYGGLETNNLRYNLGKVGDLLNLENTFIRFPETFGNHTDDTVIRIDSAYGANYPQSNYYVVMKGEPLPFLTVDGHVKEVDLDQDGAVEIVSSHGTPTETFIYEQKDGQWMKADVNRAINAISVMYKEDFVLESFFKEKESEKYEYRDNELKQIP